MWALNNHIIALPAGFVLPPFLAPFFPGLVNAGQPQPTQPPVAPGPQVDNGRG